MFRHPGAAPTLPVEALGCEREVLKSQVKTWPLTRPRPPKRKKTRHRRSVGPVFAAVRRGRTWLPNRPRLGKHRGDWPRPGFRLAPRSPPRGLPASLGPHVRAPLPGSFSSKVQSKCVSPSRPGSLTPLKVKRASSKDDLRQETMCSFSCGLNKILGK